MDAIPVLPYWHHNHEFLNEIAVVPSEAWMDLEVSAVKDGVYHVISDFQNDHDHAYHDSFLYSFHDHLDDAFSSVFRRQNDRNDRNDLALSDPSNEIPYVDRDCDDDHDPWIVSGLDAFSESCPGSLQLPGLCSSKCV